MKTLNKYPTPETLRLHSKFIADDEMPHLDAFLEMAELAQNLEQRLALCREALEFYHGQFANEGQSGHAEHALEATKPKP